MKKYNIGIIGYGNMSKAISLALTAKNEKLLIYDINLDKMPIVANSHIDFAQSNDEVVANCEFVILAIKPQVAKDVLTELNFDNDNIILSIMAGVSIEKIMEWTNNKCKQITRVMPNLMARIGRSINAYCYSELTDTNIKKVEDILQSFGKAIHVSEAQIPLITGVSGSSPAFTFMYMNGLIEVAKGLGLDESIAKMIASEIMSSSAKLVESSEENVSTLIDSVCSKGGTTIEGVNYLRQSNFEETVKIAVQKSIDRAREIEASL